MCVYELVDHVCIRARVRERERASLRERERERERERDQKNLRALRVERGAVAVSTGAKEH
jgi:hypothetical protein